MAKQDRKYMVILYPDSETYCCEEVLANLDNVFYDWAYILHENDVLDDGTPKKSHYHVVGRLGSPVLPSTLSNKMGVPENHIQYIKKWQSAERYLIHADNPEKYQYDGSNVVSNFDWLNCLDKTAVGQGQAILDEIEHNHHSVSSLARWCSCNGCYSQFVRGFAIWKAVLIEYGYIKF